MDLRSKRCATDVDRGRRLGETRVAYILIETARLRCEALAHQFGDAELLHHAHRNIGLAGYHASNHFEAELRERSLDEAHCRCGLASPSNQQQALTAVLDDVLTACDAFSYIAAHGGDPEIQAARDYARTAAERLDLALVGASCS
jgi:hypothetical protein